MTDSELWLCAVVLYGDFGCGVTTFLGDRMAAAEKADERQVLDDWCRVAACLEQLADALGDYGMH